MSERATLEVLLGEFRDKLASLRDLVDRDVRFPVADNKIKVAIGMRRAGKTYFIYQTIQILLAKGIPLTRILYINFEDDRLLPLDRNKLANLIDAFYTLYPENHDQQCYLFLDEIQDVDEWAIVVRRLHDSKNAQIYLSGSSSKLLSKEIATSLRGRSIATEIWPYSFSEYLSAKKIIVEPGLFSKKKQDILTHQINDYLIQGGFPEITHFDTDVRLKTLQEYIDVVIYRDIIERHGVKHPTLVKYMIVSMLHNVSRPFTINKFYNDIKGQGHQVNKDILYDYASFIEDAYLAFSVKLFDKSIRKVQTNPKKIFAIDTGIVNAVTLDSESNRSKLLENMIYLDLRRKGCRIYYYLTAERYEIDFLVQTIKGKSLLLQICWDMSDPTTRQREERALEQAKQELGFDGRIITLQDYLRDGLNFLD